MSVPVISPVTVDDLAELVEIEVLSFPEPWSADLLRGELELARSRRYTKVVDDGQITGYLGLMFVDDEIHVNTIAPRPGSEGRGIATWLLLDGIEAGLLRGARHLTLEVAADNLRAQELYRRFGLAPVGVRPRYYSGGIDALVMWCRDLDAPAEVARRSAILESLGSMS